MWQAIAVALLLLASAEGAALVVLAIVIRSMQRENVYRDAKPENVIREGAPPLSRRQVGFRLEE
ncbi:hypothetical protein [Sorangium sp. So ce1000]|uniref:hypothetical protein n=1 Tax=Sorangium sp. So ce1000 TaxID=3133325 RepID=UPI003F6027C2